MNYLSKVWRRLIIHKWKVKYHFTSLTGSSMLGYSTCDRRLEFSGKASNFEGVCVFNRCEVDQVASNERLVMLKSKTPGKATCMYFIYLDWIEVCTVFIFARPKSERSWGWNDFPVSFQLAASNGGNVVYRTYAPRGVIYDYDVRLSWWSTVGKSGKPGQARSTSSAGDRIDAVILADWILLKNGELLYWLYKWQWMLRQPGLHHL